jgi:hypothetical protein
MKGLVQFDTGDGEIVVVEIDDEDPGFVRAGAGELTARAATTLTQALEVLRPTARAVIQKIESLDIGKPSGTEIEMGIKFNAKTGAVLASAGGECHIRVKLTWFHHPGTAPM